MEGLGGRGSGPDGGGTIAGGTFALYLREMERVGEADGAEVALFWSIASITPIGDFDRVCASTNAG